PGADAAVDGGGAVPGVRAGPRQGVVRERPDARVEMSDDLRRRHHSDEQPQGRDVGGWHAPTVPPARAHWVQGGTPRSAPSAKLARALGAPATTATNPESDAATWRQAPVGRTIVSPASRVTAWPSTSTEAPPARTAHTCSESMTCTGPC